jgi:hypothetical protein
MANFDSFERYFKEALESADDVTSDYAYEIYRLPADQKVAFIKPHSQEEIARYLQRARKSLRSNFPDGAIFTSSNNNQSGKDLLEVNSNTQIELKSGPDQTDGNSGIKMIKWALDDQSDDLSVIMNDSMVIRRKLAIAANASGVEASKKETMDQLFSYFNNKLKAKTPAPKKLEHLVRAVSRGFTKYDEIVNLYSSPNLKNPLMLQAEWNKGLEKYSKAFLPTEIIEVKEITRTDGRAQVIVKGQSSLVKARLYPNFKNSWKSSDGKHKIPASNWVNTACFHIWIETD